MSSVLNLPIHTKGAVFRPRRYDLANELTRNGRRSGLTFASEGGSERIRKVINKMVSEEDLIRTVATAYGNGWRQVKLYFMCGLPTETDQDVMQIVWDAR